MNTQEENPYRSPEEEDKAARVSEDLKADAIFPRARIAVLSCLVIHVVCGIYLHFFHPALAFMELLAGYPMVFSAPVGFYFSFSVIRHRGFINRVLGIIGLLWFGYYLMRAMWLLP
jgi:hypothetical protein